MAQEKLQYTVCMDETGKFEEKEDKARFIGGCIYKGNDFDGENKRLKNVFEKIADSVTKKLQEEASKSGDVYEHTVVFPESFHMSNIKVKNANGDFISVSDNYEVSNIKSGILNRLMAYLSATYESKYGTSDGIAQEIKRRKGEYECFMLLDPLGKEGGFETNPRWNRFNMTNLKNPGNLYVRLATLTVSKLVYYFIREDMAKIRFLIASRTPYVVSASDKKIVQDLYGDLSQSGARVYYTQTNESTFLSTLQSKIYDDQPVLPTTPEEVAFQVDSLDYKGENDISPFLYLSDIVCLYLQRKLYAKDNYDDYEVNFELLDKLYRDMKSEKLPINIWIYDKEDGLWDNALDAMAEGDFIKMQEYFYEIKVKDETTAGAYYAKYWIPKAEAWVEQRYQTEKKTKGMYSRDVFKKRLFRYIDRVEEFVINGKNEKAKYLADVLIERMRQLGITDRKALYRLNDILLRYYNHKGDIPNTQRCLRQLNKYCGSVTGEEFLSSMNRALQWYFNQFCYDDILEIGKRSAEYEEMRRDLSREQIEELKDMMMQWGSDEDDDISEVKSRALGIIYSSLGQAYAFKGQYEDAEVYFTKALNEFDSDRDIRQTTSYRLHNMIASGQEKEYQKTASAYFGTAGPEAELKMMVPTENWADLNRAKFDLFVWVKAVTVFGWDTKEYKKAMNKLAEKVVRHMDEIHIVKSEDEDGDVHPWVLILKYLYLYGRKTGCFGANQEVDICEAIQNKMLEVQMNLKEQAKKSLWNTLDTVNGWALVTILDKTMPKHDEVRDDLKVMLKYRNGELVFKDLPKDAEAMEGYLEEKLTFMYV